MTASRAWVMAANAIELHLIGLGVPAEKARDAARRAEAAQGRYLTPRAAGPVQQTDLGISAPITAERRGDILALTLNEPPRTKKNHGAKFGIVQSAPYRKFRAAVVEAVATVKDHVGLPLPDQAYNIAATYYVDGYGKNADLAGLNQGLYDALQAAGVISDDWWFRQANGTRIVLEHARPFGVVVLITPIEIDP